MVAFAGTCMNSGKTAAVCAVVSRFCQLGLTVDAFKATGVALQRDILVMEDAGARNTGIFSDHGIVCTTSENAPMLTRKLLSSLSAEAPDAIVFELGDGLLGAYGVEAILMDPEVRRVLSAVVLSANDPVAAWGGVKLLRDKYELEPAAVTGPATDNQVGIEIIRERMNVPAANALTSRRRTGRPHPRPHRLRAGTAGGRIVSESLPVIVLGGSGYVAGEVLALLAGHPRLELAHAVSASRPGQRIASAFSHLSAVYPAARFASLDETIGALGESPRWIVISAAPHGVSASIVAKVLAGAAAAGVQASVVDASADFSQPVGGAFRVGVRQRALRAAASG